MLTWGRGTSGQLGHGESVTTSQANIVKQLEGFVITHISAGWNHSGFVSGSIFYFLEFQCSIVFTNWVFVLPNGQSYHLDSEIF